VTGSVGCHRFEGRVALVTGASRGIGLAIAARLVAEGARVGITARGREALDGAVASLGGPEQAVAIAGKADDAEHRRAAVATVLERFGPLDVLVNNTGISPVAGPLLQTPESALAKTFAVNVGAALAWTAEAIACGGLGRGEGAAVVNLASIAGLAPSPPIGAYGASKAALVHATAQLALELAPTVRVNAVAPAVVKTAFARSLYEGREKELSAGYPLGRLGLPEDVAGAVAFLASPDASWMTGQTLVVDGGVMLAGGFAGGRTGGPTGGQTGS